MPRLLLPIYLAWSYIVSSRLLISTSSDFIRSYVRSILLYYILAQRKPESPSKHCRLDKHPCQMEPRITISYKIRSWPCLAWPAARTRARPSGPCCECVDYSSTRLCWSCQQWRRSTSNSSVWRMARCSDGVSAWDVRIQVRCVRSAWMAQASA